MGQFKPMVKMMTTEPSVELKLKKGGAVEKKMQMGGALAATPAAGLPARGGMMPAAAPGKPSMAARRRAMMAGPTGAAPAAPVGMAGRMMKEGGETKSEHKAEMKKFSKLEGELKSHEGKPASKAHKGLKTGGVVNGQAGFATGGVAKANAGGYKKGGVTKMAQGGVLRSVFEPDSPSGRTSMKGVPLPGGGRYINPTGASTAVKVPPPDPGPEIPPQRAEIPEVKVPPPIPGPQIRPPQRDVGFIPPRREVGYIPPREYATGGVAKANAGGYKKGGAAKKAYATGGLVDTGRPVAMPQGNKRPPSAVSINQLSGTYKKGGAVKMKDGGDVPPEGVKDVIQTARNERAYRAWEKGEAESAKKASEGLGGMLSAIPRKLKEVFSPEKAASAPGSVTKTEKSVTVTPKKRGGAVTC